MPGNSFKVNDLELYDCAIVNYRGKDIDIRNLMMGFSVYHSLFGNGIECELLIVDAVGLIEMHPIVGDENLILSFRTPTSKEVRSYILRIYNISNREKNNQRSDVYIIKACSQEIINNNRFSVDKSYTNLPVSTIVKDIYNTKLKPLEDEFIIVKKKKLFIQESKNNYHFVFTKNRPFKAINKICNETDVIDIGTITQYDFSGKIIDKTELIDNSLSSNFVFYEDYDGWYLRTIDGLIAQKPTEDFYLADSSVAQPITQQKISNYKKINSLTYDKQFDTLEGLRQGLYSHSVETIDPITKRFTTDDFLYDTDYNKIAHLEKDVKLYSNKSLFKNKTNSPKMYYIQSNIGENYNKQPYLLNANRTDPQILNPRTLHKSFKYKLLSRLQLNNIVLRVGVPGNTDLRIGQIINIHLPQNTLVEDYMSSLNLLFTGKTDENGNITAKFFITYLKHDYNKETNNFITTFTCIKDVYGRTPIEETRDIIDEDE